MTLERSAPISSSIGEAEGCGLLAECQGPTEFSALKFIGALQRIASMQENAAVGYYLELEFIRALH